MRKDDRIRKEFRDRELELERCVCGGKWHGTLPAKELVYRINIILHVRSFAYFLCGEYSQL